MAKRGRRTKKTRRSLEQRGKLGGGQGADSVPRWERVLERKAVNNQWVISQKRRASMVSTLFETIEGDGVLIRDKISAARVVAAIDSINAQREKNEAPDQHHIHEHVGQVDVRAAVVHLQADPGYVDYLNQRALEGDGVPAADGSQPE